MVVIFSLVLIACLFVDVVGLFWTILILKIIPKVYVEIGSTMCGELVVVVSMSSVSSISKTSYIVI